MRKVYVFALFAAVGCQLPLDERTFESQAEYDNALIEDLQMGEHDTELVGTWKGTTATEDRLVFNADGTLEVQLHEQTMNKGYWRTGGGTMRFTLVNQDDPGLSEQKCTYEVTEDGHLSIKPDQITYSGSGEFRRIEEQPLLLPPTQ
jgi:hypothetical protein